MQLQTFYNGLLGQTKNIVDAAANGSFLRMNPNEAFQLLELMVPSNHHTTQERRPRRTAGVLELDALTALSAQVSALANQVQNLNVQGQVKAVEQKCEWCGQGHSTGQCAPNQVNYVENFNRNNNPFSNTYNPGWRNNPNFSWSNPPQPAVVPNNPPHPLQQTRLPPPPFQPQQPPQPDLVQMFNSMQQTMQQFMQNQQQQQQQFMQQVMLQLNKEPSERPKGALPSQPEQPRRDGKEQCMAITTRSGKTLQESINPNESMEEEDGQNTTKDRATMETQELNNKKKSKEQEVSPQVPFPSRLKKQGDEKQFQKFLNIFKKLQINIPFAEALEKMPSYVKYLKDILAKKRRVDDHEVVALTDVCSVVLQRKLPPKLKDLGRFTIPCSIGSIESKGLCDLGASVNLMPSSLYKKLGLGEIKPTRVTLQLADQSVIFPKGIVENILIKNKHLILPADFIVLDIEEDEEVPLIMGSPFLATGRTIIDVERGELIMRVYDESVVIKVFETSDYLDAILACLEADHCEDSKCASCFALMMAKRKKKK